MFLSYFFLDFSGSTISISGSSQYSSGFLYEMIDEIDCSPMTSTEGAIEDSDSPTSRGSSDLLSRMSETTAVDPSVVSSRRVSDAENYLVFETVEQESTTTISDGENETIFEFSSEEDVPVDPIDCFSITDNLTNPQLVISAALTILVIEKNVTGVAFDSIMRMLSVSPISESEEFCCRSYAF